MNRQTFLRSIAVWFAGIPFIGRPVEKASPSLNQVCLPPTFGVDAPDKAFVPVNPLGKGMVFPEGLQHMAVETDANFYKSLSGLPPDEVMFRVTYIIGNSINMVLEQAQLEGRQIYGVDVKSVCIHGVTPYIRIKFYSLPSGKWTS